MTEHINEDTMRGHSREQSLRDIVRIRLLEQLLKDLKEIPASMGAGV